MEETTTLGIVTEVGMFGSLNMKDPTVTPVDPLQGLMKDTKDPELKKFLMENTIKK